MDGIGQTVSVERPGPAQRILLARILLARCLLGCTTLVLLVLSTGLLVRSVTHQFAPLPASLLLVALCCFALFIDLCRYAARRTGRVSRLETWSCDVAGSVILVLLTSAISVNGTNVWSLRAGWIFILCHELAVYLVPRRSLLKRVAASFFRARAVERQSSPPQDATMTQRLLRWSENGEDVVLAEFHCTFEPHERQQPIHIVFCPPLLSTPILSSERLSGPPASLKVSQCHTFGARFDVRLASPATTATDVVVRVIARASNV